MKEKTKRRIVRCFSFFLAALMLFSLVAMVASPSTAFASSSNPALDQLEQEKEAIRQDKIEAGNKAASLRQQKATWVEQKQALDEKNRLAQEEILNTEKQIEVFNNMIAEKQLEAEEAQKAADAQFERYKEHIRSMEENNINMSYVYILFNAENLSDILSSLELINEIMEYDKRVEQNYKDARDEALKIKAEYEELNEELEKKKVELEEEVEKLRAEIAEADKMIIEIQKDIDRYTALYNQAAASEASVLSQINKILKEIAAAEEAAKQQQQQQQQHGGQVATAPSTTVGTGTYTWPVPGSRLVTSLYGNRMHPVLGYYRYHSGIDIGAASGSSIVAADSGTVILNSYDAGGYGHYVVISHGSGKTTLYAHMSATAVFQGQTVTKGQVIGYVGSTGLSTGPHLHFEIAVNGNRQDPLSYFGGYSIWDQAY